MLTFADKKVLSLQNKVIWTKTFKLCKTYHLLLSSLVHNSHKTSLTLQTWSALHLCTSPPPSCHMFQRPNPHPSVLHAIMDERFGDWIKGAIVEWAAEGGIFIGPMSDHSLPMSITDSLTEDIVRNWTNWPLLIRILIKGWWIDWWWSEFEVYVALAVKAANCLQKLSWLSKLSRDCLCSESCWQLVSVSQLLTPCESCQSCQQLVTTEITACNSFQSCQRLVRAVKTTDSL